MRYSIVGSLLCCAAAVQAFKDTSPFILFSSSQATTENAQARLEREGLQTQSDIVETAKSFLATCPSDIYIIAKQPAVSSAEISAQGSVPFLKAAVVDPSVKTVYSVPESIFEEGDVAKELLAHIEEACGTSITPGDRWPTPGKFMEGEKYLVPKPKADVLVEGQKYVVKQALRDLGSEDASANMEMLAENDAHLESKIFEHLPTGPSYTVLYFTSPSLFIEPPQEAQSSQLQQENEYPGEQVIYDAEFEATQHIDLKRDFMIRDDNSSKVDTRPLFEKYQYFTPGIFMGLLVGLLLLSILSVGLNAISSLQVSYGAFDKENGPAGQKK